MTDPSYAAPHARAGAARVVPAHPSGPAHRLASMPRWSPEQVRKAAPDDASLKAARGLARPGPWSETGATDTLVWGKCQGSGKVPYQVSVDVVGPAYRCSCPSRKFPCKHALALLLMWAEGGDIADASAPSDFAVDWARERAERDVKSAARAQARAGAEADPEARAARTAARIAAMDAGLADFATWLRDLVRAGTAATRGHGLDPFDAAAARLVDAQCPALAAEVRDAPELLFGESWAERILPVLGRWWTIVHAWQCREQLTEDEIADLRTALGWSWATTEVAGRGAVADRWLVLGVHRAETGRLSEQRTWMYAVQSGEILLLLDFAAGGQALPMPRVTGAVLAGELARYPGSAPQRAVLLADPQVGPAAAFPMGGGVAAAVETISAHLAANPLAVRTPLLLGDVRLTPAAVVDADGAALPLATVRPWAALAATGGHPVTCFGEWSAGGFLPLTVVVDGEAIPCG